MGTRAVVVAEERPTSRERETLRKLASYLGRASVALALAVVALAVTLPR